MANMGVASILVLMSFFATTALAQTSAPPAAPAAPPPSALYRVPGQGLPASTIVGGERGRAPYAPEALDDDETDSDPGLASVVFDHDGAQRIEELKALRFSATVNVYGKPEDPPPPKIKPYARRFGDTTPKARYLGDFGNDYGANAKPCAAFPSQATSGLGTQFNFYGFCP